MTNGPGLSHRLAAASGRAKKQPGRAVAAARRAFYGRRDLEQRTVAWDSPSAQPRRRELADLCAQAKQPASNRRDLRMWEACIALAPGGKFARFTDDETRQDA